MDKLKALFGTEALTFEQLEEKLKDNKEIKLANLVAGGYVDKRKYDDVVTERDTANNTIKGLKETVAKLRPEKKPSIPAIARTTDNNKTRTAVPSHGMADRRSEGKIAYKNTMPSGVNKRFAGKLTKESSRKTDH